MTENEKPESGESQGPIPFSERSTSYKMKVLVLSMSAFFFVVAIIAGVYNAVASARNPEKRTIIKHTKLSEMLQDARKAKADGDSLYRAGKWAEAEEKLQESQKLYIEIIDKLEKKGQTVEELEKGLSYEYIDEEYSSLTMLLKSVQEMKLRQEEKDKKRFN